MKIKTFVSVKDLATGELNGATTVVVDVLRTGSVIVAAIENGCDRIVPVASAEEAVRTFRSVEGDSLLGGEMNYAKIPDFNLGNSPEEYTSAVLNGKILLYTTTNGTTAIRSTFNAEFSCVAALTNSSAVARMLVDRGEDVKIICAGHGGRMALEDFYGAGALVERMMQLTPSIEVSNDCALLCLKLYREYKGRLHELLDGSAHYEELKNAKCTADIEYCLREDTTNVVPVYREGVISK